jgi:hypothetical protein
VVVPTPAIQLVEPKDPATIKVEALQRELEQLRSAAPILGLRFHDAGLSSVRVAPLPASEEGWPLPDDLQSSYQPKNRLKQNSMLMMQAGPLWEENERYEEQYALYRSRVTLVAQERWRVENRFLKIRLVLANTGLLKAEEINLRLAIPPMFKVHESQSALSDWPKPPQRYHVRVGLQQALGLTRQNLVDSRLRNVTDYLRAGVPSKPFEARRISRSGSGTRISYDVRELAQHDEYELRVFWLQLPDDVSADCTASINCEIRADNAPGVTKTALRLTICC